MPALPSRPPGFRELFDLKLLASVALLVTVGVVGCDLVNRAVNRRVLPRPPEPQPAKWTVGAKDRVVLTLKTQDAERSVCASNQTFEAYRCEYDGTKRKVPRSPDAPQDDNLRLVLQPYKTTVGDHLLAVGGLWYTPELAFRRHQEPSRQRRGTQLQTFYADCEVTFIGKLDTLDVRYDFGKSWSVAKDVPVARADRCTILEPYEQRSAGPSFAP